MTDDQEQHDRTATYGQTLVKIVFIALATLPMSGYLSEDDKRVRATGPSAEDAVNQTAQQLERDVKKALRGRDFRWVEISIEGSKATLVGQVQDFWAKDQAVRQALDVDGIETVVSELKLPERESDNEIAQDIDKVIQRYAHYTIWDHIIGRVNDGKVFLEGRVTPDRNKVDELFERVAKVKGVQDIQNNILTLPQSHRDERVRRSIASRFSSNFHFERLASMVNPPFHIVVQNGVITLVGYVQTQFELIEMRRIVGLTPAVLRVENRLRTLKGAK